MELPESETGTPERRPNFFSDSSEIPLSNELEPDPADDAAANSPSSEGNAELFVQLHARFHRQVATYILTLVPKWEDAEDIVQETNVILWREFAKFKPGTNFLAWACTIAFHQVLSYRKRCKRDKLRFSDAFLEAVAREASDSASTLEQRQRLLARCIERLGQQHREVLHLRYYAGLPIEKIAERVGRTDGALYRLLSRIRHSLSECVNENLASAPPASP